MPATPRPHNAAAINDASYGDFGLAAEDVRVARGGVPVAEGVTFRIGRGDWLELRGPNGGGKTSLLRCLAGLSPPDGGRIEWREPGEPPAASARGRCAWLGHLDGLQPHFTVRETLAFWARAGDGGDPLAAAEALGLTRFLDAPAQRLSAGWRRRAGLARLILLDRPLWLLDEPFANLDARGAGLAGQAIATHLARGGAAVAATHGSGPALLGGRILRLEAV
jgi:heme exporter protein A